MNKVISMIGIRLFNNSKTLAMICWIVLIRLEIVASRMLWLLVRRLRVCRWMLIMRMDLYSMILILFILIRLISN
jgi:hypothetical protein